MKYFLDTEFIENGRTIDLISIAIVSDYDDGREYYAFNEDAHFASASQWVKENVFGKLPPPPVASYFNGTGVNIDPRWKSKQQIKQDLLNFFSPTGNWEKDVEGIEFWAYYSDYDWVAFCQIFGSMMDLPPGFPMYCRDIKQLQDMVQRPGIDFYLAQEDEHDALADARYARELYQYITQSIAN